MEPGGKSRGDDCADIREDDRADACEDGCEEGRAEVGGSRGGVKLWVFVGIVAVLLVLNWVFGWSETISVDTAVAQLRGVVDANPVLAGLVYVAASIVGCVVLALPGIIFALVAGTVFGAVWGTALCWAAVTLGACLSFVVGRFFLKDALKPKLAKSAALNRLLFEGAERSDVYLLAVTRLVPLFPYNLQNFAYGVTDIRFVPYAVYSAIFMLPGTAVYTVAAAGLVEAENRLLYFAIAAILLVVTLLVARVLKRGVTES